MQNIPTVKTATSPLSDWLSQEIYEWAGDWSNYFEAGFEWWGAYLWTVCDRATGAIAAIGASTTD